MHAPAVCASVLWRDEAVPSWVPLAFLALAYGELQQAGI